MPTYSASSATELYSLLASTVSEGDTIELATGTYSLISLSGYAFTDFVTITSADGNYGAKVTKFILHNCEYLKFTKIDFLKTAAGTAAADNIVELKAYDHITFDDVKVRCSNASNLYYTGIYKRANYVGTHLTIQNSLIENVNGGIILYKGSGLTDYVTISGNEISDIHDDANKYSGTRYLTFEENYIHSFRQRGDLHCDLLQMEGSASHWIIRRNYMLPMGGPTVDIQGFFINQVAVDDFLIEDNIIYTHHVNGIKVRDGSTNVIIRRNTLIFDPTDDGSTQNQCLILAPSATVTDNVTCTNGTGNISGTNLAMNCDNPSDPLYYGDLITDPLNGVTTVLADLVAVAGEAADGKGAAAYLAELLGGDTAPTISGAPTLSGLETVGQTITATAQSTSGTSPITHTFQFTNNTDGVVQAYSTSNQYELQATDQGDTIFVTHKATNDFGEDTAVSSNTGTIGAAVSNPTLSSLSPADNATGVALNTTLQVTLNKNIQFGSSGTVKLYNLTTGVGPVVDPNSQVGQWTVAADAGGAMTIASATLTVTRAGLLREGHNYCVTVSSGTLESTDGGTFAGISGATAWNFTATGASTPTTGVRVGNGLLSVAGKIILVG